jgi:single-strand DNA-binding protein
MLIGHLGKDAETRHTQSGTAVTNFTLATSWRTKNQQTGEWREETDWHDIVMWKAENVASYLQKGKQVFVEGRLQTRSWEDQGGNKKYKTEVVVDNLILLSSRGGDGGGAPSSGGNFAPQESQQPGGEASPGSGDSPAASNQGITDDDVPF